MRLFIATVEYGAGAGVRLVGVFLAIETHGHANFEAESFLQRGNFGRLNHEMKDPAQKPLDYWIGAVLKERQYYPTLPPFHCWLVANIR